MISATPAIDNKPPITRSHINVKLKKQQKEVERIRQIERDNNLLLKKMNYIMKTSRVDNYWTTPQPRFLNRIPMYDILIPKLEDITLDEEIDAKSRKEKCYACSKLCKTEKQRRERSKSVPVRRELDLPPIKEEKQRAKTSIPLRKPVLNEPNCIILSRGSLQLSVNFPSDTSVKLQDGNKQRFVLKNLCSCRNSPIR